MQGSSLNLRRPYMRELMEKEPVKEEEEEEEEEE